MPYIVKDVIKITKNSSIVAVDDRMQEIKIGMYLDGFVIKSLKRNDENDLVDLYIKDTKKQIDYKINDLVEILTEEEYKKESGSKEE